MPQLTLVLMLVGAFIVVLGLFMDISAHPKNRSREMAPFRSYFEGDYDRDLLRQSSWSDGERPPDPRTRFHATDVGDCSATEHDPESSSAIRRNRDRE